LPAESTENAEEFKLKGQKIYGTQMGADLQDFNYKELTDRIIKIFYKVYNKLGYGLLEKG